MNEKHQHNNDRKQTKDYSSALSSIKTSIEHLKTQIASIDFNAEPPTRRIERNSLRALISYTVLTGVLVILTAFLFFKASQSAKLAVVADSTAIKTLVETKREFNIRNRTFLQIVNVAYDTSMPDGVQIVFDILNNGTSPGYIDYYQSYFVQHGKHTAKLDLITDGKAFIVGSPGFIPRHQSVENIAGVKESFERGLFWLQLRGKILYHSYGDTTKYLYLFTFDIKPEIKQNKYHIDVKTVQNEELPSVDTVLNPLDYMFESN